MSSERRMPVPGVGGRRVNPRSRDLPNTRDLAGNQAGTPRAPGGGMAFDRTARFASLPAVALALSLAACGPSEDDFATAIVTSALQSPQAQELSDDVVDAPCGMLTAEHAAAEAAARP